MENRNVKETTPNQELINGCEAASESLAQYASETEMVRDHAAYRHYLSKFLDRCLRLQLDRFPFELDARDYSSPRIEQPPISEVVLEDGYFECVDVVASADATVEKRSFWPYEDEYGDLDEDLETEE